MATVALAESAPDASILLRSIETGRREVVLNVSHQGHVLRTPSAATEMLVWGDVDPNCNGRIEPTQGGSEWLPYMPEMELVLSAGAGTKTVRVKLRGPLGTTDEMTATSVVGSTPHTSMLWSAYRIGGPTLLGWSPSVACTAYRFAMCSNEFDDYDTHEPFLEGGALTPGQYVEIAVPEHDASHIIVKMFIQVGGQWHG
jgi:hypothetical protein